MVPLVLQEQAVHLVQAVLQVLVEQAVHLVLQELVVIQVVQELQVQVE